MFQAKLVNISAAEVRKRTDLLFAKERSGLARRQLLRIHICPFENLLSHARPTDRVLDIGCGAGLLLGLVAAGSPNLTGIGVDASGDAIECARRMARRMGFAHLSFEVSPDTSNWPDGKFGMVFVVDVMHHVPLDQRRAFFKAAADRVEDGGLLLFKDMRQRPRWRAAMNVLHDLVVARQWVSHPDRSDIEKWGPENGLTLLRYEEWNRYWYGHGFWLFKRASDAPH